MKKFLAFLILATSCFAQTALNGGNANGGTISYGGNILSAPSAVSCPDSNVGVLVACPAITLVNVGSGSITALAVGNPTGTNAGDFAQTNTCSATLAVGAACTISVNFTPGASGARTASIAVTSSLPTKNISLLGTGLSTSFPVAVVSPLSLSFTSPKSVTSASQAVSYTNQGPGSDTVSTLQITGTNAADFAETDNCAGQALAVSASCSINITCTPSLVAVESATLNINDTTQAGQELVSLSCTGTSTPGPNTNLQPASSYQYYQFKTTTAAQGAGTGPVTSLAEITFYDDNGVPFLPSGWTVTADSTDATSSVANADDSNAGTFWITNLSGSPGQPHNITFNVGIAKSISGFSITPRQDGCDNGWPENSIFNAGSDGVNWKGIWTGTISYTGDTLACPGANQPRVKFESLQTGSQTFPDTIQGMFSAPQTITLTNTGNASLAINGFGVNNANHNFANVVDNCGSSLAAGASCTYTVQFNPLLGMSTSGQEDIATFSVNDNSVSGSSQVVTLSGYALQQGTYTTSFASPPAPENPISEYANWVTGPEIGVPSTFPGGNSMQTVAGKAYGTQNGTAGCSSTSLSVCNDSAAALKGNWTPNQHITATAINASPNSAAEIELHLRSNISTSVKKAQLYEVDIRETTGTSSAFINIARWNGDGTFDTICVNNGSQYGAANGDKFFASITGDNGANGTVTITVVKNNTITVTCQDSSSKAILTGNPGMGAYTNLGLASGPNWGWSNFTATSDGTGSSTTGSSTTFSVTNEPPPTWYAYTNSGNLFNKPLPADKMSHLAVPTNYGITGFSSDQIAQATLTEDGFTPVPTFSSSPGTSDIYIGYALFDSPASDGTAGTSDGNTPVYYSKSTDPWYKLQSANGSTATIIMRAPNAAMGSHPCANSSRCDSLLAIWDQTLGVYADMYGSVLGPLQLPNASGCGSSPSTACVFNLLNQQSGAIAPSTNNDWDTTLVNTTVQGVTERLGSSGSNLGGKYAGKPDGITPTTFNEQMAGQIFHAMSGGLGCTNADGKPVFPASITAWVCGSTGSKYTLPNGGRNIIPNGALLFCDYTDAQIASMGLDTLQKGFITALCHYGVYPDVTSDYEPSGALQLIGEDSQSGLAYRRITGAQHPIFNWIATTQHIGATGGGTLTANRLAASQFCCGTNNAPPQSQYRMNLPMAWGLPLMTCNTVGDSGCSTRHDASGRACANSPGCDISGHVHWLDPCAVAGMAGISGTGVPTACVGDLYVTLAGSQQGTISSNPSGINCDYVTSCNIAEANNTSITLTATPAAGHTFTGWSGACTGTGPCVVTVNGTQGVKQVTATFN